MANTVTGPTNQDDGEKKLIVYCSVYSDGSASSTTLVDVSALNQSANKETCTHVALNKIWYSVGGGTDAPASLDWDADTDNDGYGDNSDEYPEDPNRAVKPASKDYTPSTSNYSLDSIMLVIIAIGAVYFVARKFMK